MYLYTVRGLAKQFSISEPTIYKNIKLGMPCTKAPNGRFVFNVEEVTKWLRGEIEDTVNIEEVKTNKFTAINIFDNRMKKMFEDDKEKYNVMCWIIFNANYEVYKSDGLNERECNFSYSILENFIGISHSKLQKIMKELEEDKFVKWIYKSKSKYKSSIVYLIESNETKLFKG